jgi:hypothetical protein
MVLVVVEMVSVSPPPKTKRDPVTESAEFADETVPVATEARVVNPPTFVMYATCEIAMSEVVAIAFKPVVEMVTFPVAPETEIPEPATFESTPALLKEVPSYVSPVPAVVVATPTHPRFVYARVWPGVPVKRELVVVEIERTEGVVPRTTMGFESARAPLAVRVVVATDPRVVLPLVLVKYERPETAMSEVVAIS